MFLEGGRFLDQDGKQVALLGQVYSGEQLDYLPAMMGQADVVVINDLDWQVNIYYYKLLSNRALHLYRVVEIPIMVRHKYSTLKDDILLSCICLIDFMDTIFFAHHFVSMFFFALS